jgi:hypothetical protein
VRRPAFQVYNRGDCLKSGDVWHRGIFFASIVCDRERGVATLFGRVTVRLPRFCCAACGGIEGGVGWPSHCRSTPELDQLQAHLCALMSYRTAAGVLQQMFPVDAGKALRPCAVIP